VSPAVLQKSGTAGVKPWDPVVLAEIAAILGIAAFIAAVLPAQRAAGIEPMVALRFE